MGSELRAQGHSMCIRHTKLAVVRKCSSPSLSLHCVPYSINRSFALMPEVMLAGTRLRLQGGNMKVGCAEPRAILVCLRPGHTLTAGAACL